MTLWYETSKNYFEVFSEHYFNQPARPPNAAANQAGQASTAT